MRSVEQEVVTRPIFFDTTVRNQFKMMLFTGLRITIIVVIIPVIIVGIVVVVIAISERIVVHIG